MKTLYVVSDTGHILWSHDLIGNSRLKTFHEFLVHSYKWHHIDDEANLSGTSHKPFWLVIIKRDLDFHVTVRTFDVFYHHYLKVYTAGFKGFQYCTTPLDHEDRVNMDKFGE